VISIQIDNNCGGDICTLIVSDHESNHCSFCKTLLAALETSGKLGRVRCRYSGHLTIRLSKRYKETGYFIVNTKVFEIFLVFYILLVSLIRMSVFCILNSVF
jgi:hypothetical protein